MLNSYIRYGYLGLLLIVGGLTLFGCSTPGGLSEEDQAKLRADWAYQADGIKLKVTSSDDMNSWDGEAHTVVLGVIQMDDPTEFQRISGDRTALLQLINEGRAPVWSVQLSRYVLNLGVKTATMLVERAQKAKHLGIVAGYYHFDVSQGVKFFSIPLKVTEEDSGYVARPVQVKIELHFGRQQIISSTLTAVEEQPDAPETPDVAETQKGRMPAATRPSIYPIKE